MAVWEDTEHLPTTMAPAGCWWGTLTPRRQEESLSEPVGHGGTGKGEEKWKPDKIGIPEAGEIRKGRWEGPSRKSGKGPEGDCPAHAGPGGLLSSQAGPMPSKATTHPPHPRCIS